MSSPAYISGKQRRDFLIWAVEQAKAVAEGDATPVTARELAARASEVIGQDITAEQLRSKFRHFQIEYPFAAYTHPRKGQRGITLLAVNQRLYELECKFHQLCDDMGYADGNGNHSNGEK
jgi:hypothetical protein